jgi:long-chain fatty acid transport protein
MKSLSTRAALAAGMACALAAGEKTAQAAGFASQRFGGEQGTVVAVNPTSLYYNPGAAGFTEGSQLGLYGSLAIRHATYSHQPAPTDLTSGGEGFGNSGENHLLNVFGGPALGGLLKVGNLVLGAGFFAPFYGRAHWAKDDAIENTANPPKNVNLAEAADGVQRWFGIDGEISVVYFTVGAAYRLGPLSIGAAGNLVSSNLVDYRAKTAGGQGQARSDYEGRASMDVKGFNGSFAVGAMLEVLPEQLWLAASYQAQPGLGEQGLDGNLDITSPGGPQHFNITLHQSLPDVYRAGVRWRPRGTPVELRVFGDYTRWSKLASQCGGNQGEPCVVHADGSDASPNLTTQFNFERNWNDTWGARVGASYWVKPSVEVFVGAGYETAAAPDATMTPDLMDANNIAGSLGARFQLTRSLYLSASYTHIQFMTRDTTGKSTLASPTNDPNSLVSPPTLQPDAGGVYTQWIGVASGNLEAVF